MIVKSRTKLHSRSDCPATPSVSASIARVWWSSAGRESADAAQSTSKRSGCRLLNFVFLISSSDLTSCSLVVQSTAASWSIHPHSGMNLDHDTLSAQQFMFRMPCISSASGSSVSATDTFSVLAPDSFTMLASQLQPLHDPLLQSTLGSELNTMVPAANGSPSAVADATCALGLTDYGDSERLRHSDSTAGKSGVQKASGSAKQPSGKLSRKARERQPRSVGRPHKPKKSETQLKILRSYYQKDDKPPRWGNLLWLCVQAR